MDCFAEYSAPESGGLLIHIEFYFGSGVHTADYAVNAGGAEKLRRFAGGGDAAALLRYLTENFSANNKIFGLLSDLGIGFEKLSDRYEDTSSDV
jgi:hypothetical protein